MDEDLKFWLYISIIGSIFFLIVFGCIILEAQQTSDNQRKCIEVGGTNIYAESNWVCNKIIN